MVGRRLGEYLLVRPIGAGGMGSVYEAVQEGLGRRVAVKVLRGAHALSPKAVRRFHREAEAIARLHHPHIIPVYTVGEQDGIHFYAMELVHGVSLERVIRRRRTRPGLDADPFDPRLYDDNPTLAEGPVSDQPPAPPPPPTSASGRLARSRASFVLNRQYINHTVEVIAQAADALHHAHGEGIIHRDVKPANLLLAAPRTVVLTDFGLAHQEGAESLTITGDLFGTPMYMSPEQVLAGQAPIDHRTDVYSLGATLYELVTLQPPCQARDANSIMQEVLHKEPRSFRQLRVRLPRDLEVIVFKAMEKRPERRYPTARDFADDLRRFLNYQPIRAKPPGLLTTAGKFLRRHRTEAAVGLSVLLTALLLVFGLSWRAGRGLEQELAALVERGSAELDQARAARGDDEAEQHFDRARESFSAALALDRRHTRAADGLFEVHLARCRRALDRQAFDVARGMLIPLKELDRGGAHADAIAELSRRAAGTGTWKLDTTPGGCHVRLARLDDDFQPGPFQDFGTTPLAERDIPMGDYLVVLSHPDCPLVRYPMLVERGEAKDLHVVLPRKDQVPKGMVYVPAGEFLFGEAEAGTLRKVRLEGYFIDRTEVTGADYEKFVQATGARPPEEWNDNKTCPPELRTCAVHNVSWFEALEFARWAGKRLPTEAEWEKAARGVDGRRYPWGNRFERHRCTWRETPAREYGLAVGLWPKGASPYGCLDMAGNVWEWTADREKPFGSQRVIRGGAVPDTPDLLTALRRQPAPPAGVKHGALNFLGFRCVRPLNPEPPRKPLDDLEYRGDLAEAVLVYGDHGRFDMVVACAERLLQLNPQSVSAHVWKGFALGEQNKPAEALQALKFAYLRGDGSDGLLRPEIDKRIAEVEKAGGKVDKAFLAASDLFEKTRVALSKKRFPEAEQYLRKLLELDPDHPIAHEALGEVCAATGRPEEAARHFGQRVADYRRLLQEEPGSARLHHQLARFLLQKGFARDEALTHARRAAELEPEDPAYVDLMAELLYLSGKPAEAVAAGRQAVELAHDKRFYQEQLRKYQLALDEQNRKGAPP
jgi:serine/threonine protein kinase/tetratricopeptide (TPR) repeat protein